MGHSDFVVMLARPRSGTNAIRSVLDTHPDICCLDEVFSIQNRTSKHELTRRSNFFNFLVTYASGDVTRIFPDRHDRVFVDFLDYLRRLSSKRFILMDVKYSTMHLLTPPHKRYDHPYLFDLTAKNGLRVLNLIRTNYLRFEVSQLKAVATGQWSSGPQDLGTDPQVSVNVALLLDRLQLCDSEDRMIRKYFRGYGKYLSYDYQDVFPTATDGVADAFLRRMSGWLGIGNSYANEPSTEKQSHLPLRQTIKNYEEVVAVLRGSNFEYCLEDEPSYRPASPSGG